MSLVINGHSQELDMQSCYLIATPCIFKYQSHKAHPNLAVLLTF